MKKSSALDLKHALSQRARARIVEEVSFTTARAVSNAGTGIPGLVLASREDSTTFTVKRPAPLLAFGVSAIAGRPRDFALAVRVSNGRGADVARFLKELPVRGEELDLVVGVEYRPRVSVRAGNSVGHYAITAGTLGGFVEDATNHYMLSNNHVFANTDRGRVGDPILQPGPKDIAGPVQVAHHHVGDLARWLPLSPALSTNLDAALATFTSHATHFYPWEYAGIGTMTRTPSPTPFSCSEVVKRGRTTGVTQGQVRAVSLDGIGVDFGLPGSPMVITFDNVIEIVGKVPSTPFSQPGDSGSFILDANSLDPYALLFAGGPDGGGVDRTLAHFLPDVLEALDVRIVQ